MKQTRFKIEKRQHHPDCYRVGWCRAHPEHKTCVCTEWVLTYKGKDMIGRLTQEEAEALLAALKEDRKG